MDADEPGWAIIDDFFRDLAVGRSAATTRRYLRVRARLYAFLDTVDLSPALGADAVDALLVDLARCLPAFVRAPWVPEGLTEARVHLSVVSRLAARMGTGSARDQTDVAVAQARDRLDDRSAVASTHQMPPRFLAPPGPRW